MNGTNPSFLHLNPYAGGNFDVTYISYKTLFGKFYPNRVSETFKTFQQNRIVLSQRLGKLNPYSSGQPVGADGFYYGYGKYAVDVLIPSFISAYTGQDPNNIALIKQKNENVKSNPFRLILPKPNWKIDYNGLGRVKPLDKLFTSLTVSHGYTGNLSMNGFFNEICDTFSRELRLRHLEARMDELVGMHTFSFYCIHCFYFDSIKMFKKSVDFKL